MKLHTLKFNDEMLKAVIDGSKTQTRRPIEGYPVFELADNGLWRIHGPSPREQHVLDDDDNVVDVIPEGIFEKVLILPKYIDRYCPYTKGETFINACDKDGNPVWKLAVKVRVERLVDISNDDAKAEGYPAEREADGGVLDPWLWFRSLWSGIYPEHTFADNPWVWVIEFKRVEAVV